jgi:hypothetical protein
VTDLLHRGGLYPELVERRHRPSLLGIVVYKASKIRWNSWARVSAYAIFEERRSATPR